MIAATLASREGRTVLIESRAAVVVAQSDQEQHPWGVWQFPTIRRLADNDLEVTFSRTVDDASLDSADKRYPDAPFISADGGQTWQETDEPLSARCCCRLQDGTTLRLNSPAEADIPKAQLPGGFPFEHGYGGIYTIRDPLRMPQGPEPWHLVRTRPGQAPERIPAHIDDPDHGVICYDPPEAAHAVVRWRCLEQILELSDGSLLAVGYGAPLQSDRKPLPKWASYCLKSADGGESWRTHGTIAHDPDQPLAGYTEPQATVLPDGSLLAVLRTECSKTGSMYRTRSTDGGETWSAPEELWPFGVLPQLLTLENGVTVMAFGRPGVHLLFSDDGKGEHWQAPIHLVVESFEGTGLAGESFGFQKGEDPSGRPKQTRTSGYTGLVATGPDSFMIAYDQFDYPNADGVARKTILAQAFAIGRR
jgi:hypothetical protein